MTMEEKNQQGTVFAMVKKKKRQVSNCIGF